MADTDSYLRRCGNFIVTHLARACRVIGPCKYFVDLAVGPDDRLWNETGIPLVRPYVPNRDGQPEHNLHILDKQRSEAHRGIFGTFEGVTHVVVVSDLSKIQTILNNPIFFQRRIILCKNKKNDNMLCITADRDKWERIRNLIMPQFSSVDMIREVVPLMEECADDLLETIEMDDEGRGVVADGVVTFRVFALHLICRLLFGDQSPVYNNPESQFFELAVQLHEGREDIFLKNALYPGFKRGDKNSHFTPRAMTRFKQHVNTEIKDRLDSGSRGAGLLRMLMDAVTARTISENDLHAQCIMLIGVSFPEISMTLAAACWEISRSEVIRTRLRREIDDSLRIHQYSYENAVVDMTYLEQVLKETMRKYPAAARIERVCNEDTHIGDTLVRKGFVCAIPVFALHHNPEFFPDPEEFDPERFAEGIVITPNCYLPFGEGSRKCLAWQFAMWEMKTFMAFLLHNVNLVPSDDTANLVFNVRKNMMVPEAIPFNVQRRHGARELVAVD